MSFLELIRSFFFLKQGSPPRPVRCWISLLRKFISFLRIHNLENAHSGSLPNIALRNGLAAPNHLRVLHMVATPGFFHPAMHYKFRMCHLILFWSTLISSAWNMQRDASSADFAAQAQKLEFLEAEVERMFSPCHSDSERANSPGKLWSCKVFIANSKGLILFVQVELYQRGLEECRTYLSTCLESNERLTRWVVLKTFMILSSITVGRS